MSSYYDPWVHAVQLFINRLFLFIFLSVLLGLGWWGVLLWKVFHVEPEDMAKSSWAVMTTTPAEVMPRVILGQSVVIGALITAWLFTWLIVRARLRRGDRHHRGSRVVDMDRDD